MLTHSLPNDTATSHHRLQLICLPHAGGGTAAFWRWKPQLPPWLQLVPVCPPGRESRVRDAPHTQLSQLVTEAANTVTRLTAGPFALLGISLGAVVAFELAREIRRRGLPGPTLLVVAASRAPHDLAPMSLIHELPDEQFLQRLNEQYGNIPDAVSHDRELQQLLLPAIRSDVCMLETYEYREAAPLDVDILAIGGTEDQEITPSSLVRWRSHTNGRFSSRQFPGGHFFLMDATTRSNAALEVIVNRLDRVVPR